MADTQVSAALSEINSALDEIKPVHEGLRDFARLNLGPETLRDVKEEISRYDRRMERLIDAKEALEALINDGHPDLKPRPIMEAELEELTNNAATIAAALTKFTAQASALGLSAKGTEPK